MFIEEDEVNINKLADIFTGGFMDVSDNKEITFSVKGCISNVVMNVELEHELKAIRFFDFIGLKGFTPQDAVMMCNQLNSNIKFGKYYYFPYKDALMAAIEFRMTYEKGLIPHQLVTNFRLFESSVLHLHQRIAEYLKS